MMLLQSIILTLTTHSIYALAQLTFQTDPYRNTFTLKTPSLQQTFTRYYGGQQQVNGLPTRLHQQQQQQSLNIQQQQQDQPHQVRTLIKINLLTSYVRKNFLYVKLENGVSFPWNINSFPADFVCFILLRTWQLLVLSVCTYTSN